MGKREGLTLKCLGCNKTLVVMSPDFFLPSKAGENEPCEILQNFVPAEGQKEECKAYGSLEVSPASVFLQHFQ